MRKTLAGLAALATIGALSACAVPEEEATTTTNTGGSASKGEKQKKEKKAQPDNSTATKDGPVTWGNWQIVGPLDLKADALSQYELKMRVKNIGEAQDEGFFTVTVLKGNRILTTMDCSTSTVGPGQIATSECLSFEDFVPGWTEITIENAF